MTGIVSPHQQDLRPAARDDLAAAGPVEPSPSPDMAPGPTPCAAAADYAAGELRRRYVAAVLIWRSHGEGAVPTLAFVPGIEITGRYRMRQPS